MANNESKVLKNNTLEQWRQKTNEVSYHLGDVDQLDNRLTDKVYTYSNTSESVFSVYDADASSKNLRFEIKPEETIDAVATIIMTGNPTIPSSFVSDVVLFQGSSGSETFTGTAGDVVFGAGSFTTVTASTSLGVGSDWTVALNGSDLQFLYQGTVVAQIDSTGQIDAKQDVIADSTAI